MQVSLSSNGHEKTKETSIYCEIVSKVVSTVTETRSLSRIFVLYSLS